MKFKKIFAIAAVAAITLLAVSCQGKTQPSPAAPKQTQTAIPPARYARMLGKGLDVDWAHFPKRMALYSPEEVKAIKQIGFSHVRIRVKDDLSPELLKHLDRVITDTLNAGLIPVLAYKAEDFKENPNEKNFQKVVWWWRTVAKHYQNAPPELSFDLIIEVTDALSHQPETLNRLYEAAVAEIRKTNPTRIIFISPRRRSNPELLHELRIPSQANGYLMAEWHFYAAGPSKTNPKKQWTVGTPAEKALITKKIEAALAWQKETGIYTWVGAWMPGDYNHGNHYSIPEQVRFATFVACQLDAAHIPFAVNSDSKFYDQINKHWIPEMRPVLEAILRPKCAER